MQRHRGENHIPLGPGVGLREGAKIRWGYRRLWVFSKDDHTGVSPIACAPPTRWSWQACILRWGSSSWTRVDFVTTSTNRIQRSDAFRLLMLGHKRQYDFLLVPSLSLSLSPLSLGLSHHVGRKPRPRGGNSSQHSRRRSQPNNHQMGEWTNLQMSPSSRTWIFQLGPQPSQGRDKPPPLNPAICLAWTPDTWELWA